MEQAHDSRELYLLIETPNFASVIPCLPDGGPKVRLLANSINNMSKNAAKIQKNREGSIGDAKGRLEEAKEACEIGLRQTQALLDAARKETARLHAARTAIGLHKAGADLVETSNTE